MYLHIFISNRDFVEEKLGSKYVGGRALDFATSFEESGPSTPMFFILSPGVDPLKDVENQGEKHNNRTIGAYASLLFVWASFLSFLFLVCLGP